jgi:hypothetical protein
MEPVSTLAPEPAASMWEGAILHALSRRAQAPPLSRVRQDIEDNRLKNGGSRSDKRGIPVHRENAKVCTSANTNDRKPLTYQGTNLESDLQYAAAGSG